VPLAFSIAALNSSADIRGMLSTLAKLPVDRSTKIIASWAVSFGTSAIEMPSYSLFVVKK
jgi:hypothetical protein